MTVADVKRAGGGSVLSTCLQNCAYRHYIRFLR